MYLDLADLKSVKDFSSRVADNHEQVDIAVLAAAIAGKPYKPSSQVRKGALACGVVEGGGGGGPHVWG